MRTAASLPRTEEPYMGVEYAPWSWVPEALRWKGAPAPTDQWPVPAHWHRHCPWRTPGSTHKGQPRADTALQHLNLACRAHTLTWSPHSDGRGLTHQVFPPVSCPRPPGPRRPHAQSHPSGADSLPPGAPTWGMGAPPAHWGHPFRADGASQEPAPASNTWRPYLSDGRFGVHIPGSRDLLQLVHQLCDGQPLLWVDFQHGACGRGEACSGSQGPTALPLQRLRTHGSPLFY